MKHKFFISHFGKDKAIADLFSNSLRRITLARSVLGFHLMTQPVVA